MVLYYTNDDVGIILQIPVTQLALEFEAQTVSSLCIFIKYKTAHVQVIYSYNIITIANSNFNL